ncbi:MAG: tyrosinase family protein [Candidatus Melainabacteria bacterium]|jgi:tyrosinase|nr:MAG: tyrosinase family protein [Candidatus Melainabacteria bacterium]
MVECKKAASISADEFFSGYLNRGARSADLHFRKIRSDTTTAISLRRVVLRTRTSIVALTPDEFKVYYERFAELQTISDSRGFNHIAGFHGVPGEWCHQQFPYDTFLPWHRAYLYWLELHFLDGSAFETDFKTLALSYWDWTSQDSHREGIPSRFLLPDTYSLSKSRIKSISGANASGPQDRDSVRNPLKPEELPSLADVLKYLNEPDFLAFSNKLETGAHNNVHGWIGGDMAQVAYAAYDPIFYAHHCMIDKIWHVWQNKHGNSTVPNSILDTVLAPFPMTVRDTLDIKKLGYNYPNDL